MHLPDHIFTHTPLFPRWAVFLWMPMQHQLHSQLEYQKWDITDPSGRAQFHQCKSLVPVLVAQDK